MEANSNSAEDPLGGDRERIKELRKIRNKIKRERKRDEKLRNPPSNQTQNEAKTTKCGVTIVTEKFYNQYRCENVASTSSKRKTKEPVVVNLVEVASAQKNTKIHQVQKRSNIETLQVANKLDKSQPVLSKGKHSETAKPKKVSKLKKEILHARKNEQVSSVVDDKPYNYANNIVTDNLVQLSCAFLNEIVQLQENYYAKDPIKAQIKRRFIVGFHQLKKYLTIGKVHIFFITVDIKVTFGDPLDVLIKELVQWAEENGVNYVFVLKRRQLGRLTLKQLPASCLGVLNYDGHEGANEKYKLLLEEITRCKDAIRDTNLALEGNICDSLLEKLQGELRI